MRDHIASLKAALEPLNYPVHYVDATGATTYPYLLLWSSAGRPGVEVALDDAQADINDIIGVTSVAATPEGVLAVSARVRGALAPGRFPTRLSVPGHVAWVRFEDSRPVDVDRDITLPGTSRHPAFGVDTYRLISTPMAGSHVTPLVEPAT